MITLAALIILLLTVAFLFGAIQGVKKQLIAFDKEQHEQNKEIIQLMKYKLQTDEMLLQHIEILQYLCEQDPMLSRARVPYTGPIGEA